MKCPLCNIEMRIDNSHPVFENDNTPDEETKVFMQHDLKCRNKSCQNYEKVVETVKNPFN